MQLQHPSRRMYRALQERDSSFEGIFFFGVRTTGVFCRPTCRARKPRRENVEFFASSKEALLRGYRPCKLCQPMLPAGEVPRWVRAVLEEATRAGRMKDFEVRRLGVDPSRLRRWFNRNHGMTFQAYLRSLRLATAFGSLRDGGKVIEAAFDQGYGSLSGFSEAFRKMTGASPSASTGKTAIHLHRILTPIGPMLAASVREGVCLVEFADRRMLERELDELRKRLSGVTIVSKGPHMLELERQLGEYFAGKRKSFSVPLVTPGSEFQKKVWAGLLKIPYGELRSYKDQALALGEPRAVRAVARANGQNRIAILIPCHRVVGADGKLVGYSGGLARKKHLLGLERDVRGLTVS